MRPMTLTFGKFRCDLLSDGPWWLDGGCLFGVVPRGLWQKLTPPDSRNRVKLGLNSLLVRDGTHTVLIETGIGPKIPKKRRSWYDIGDSMLPGQLESVGCSPEAVDTVILTHLHFDHAGGNTLMDASGTVVPAFPNARYIVQALEWEDAVNPTSQTRAGYLWEDYLPLGETGQLQLVTGDTEVIPGLRLQCTGGHTRGHQIILLESEGKTLCYTGDILPLAVQLKPLYVTAFDLYPVDTFNVKTRLLEQAVREGWLLIPGHDDDFPLIRVVPADGGYAFEVPSLPD